MKKITSIFLLFVSTIAFCQDMIWTDRIASIGNNYVFNVKVDTLNNDTYATGRVKSPSTFGENSTTPVTPIDQGDRDIYITKHDNTGDLQWAKRFGGLFTDLGMCIEIGVDHIYLGGLFEDTCFFDNDTLIATGMQDAFFMKMDKNGNIIWLKSWGGLGNDRIVESYLDDNDNLVLVGLYEDSINFDGIDLINTIALTYPTRESSFLCKIDTSGNILWAENQQSTRGVRPTDVSIKDNYVYVVGNCYGNTEFGGIVYISVNTGNYDQFLVKYDVSSNFKWTQLYGNNLGETFTNIEKGEDDNIFITGFFKGNVTYGSDIYNTGVQQGIVVKTDTSGAVLKSYPMLSTQISDLDGVAYESGRIFVGGYFADTLFIMNDTVVSFGNYDMIKIELDEDLIPISYEQIGGTNYDRIRAFASGSNGYIAYGGDFRGTVDFTTVTFLAASGKYDGFVTGACSSLIPNVSWSDTSFCINDALTIIDSTLGLHDNSFVISDGFISYLSKDSIEIQFNSPGINTVTIYQENFCKLDSVIINYIQIDNVPSLNLGNDFESCAPDIIFVNAVGMYDSIVWDNGVINIDSISISTTTNVSAEVWNDAGCASSDTVLITLKDCSGLNELYLNDFSAAYYSNQFIELIPRFPISESYTYQLYNIKGNIVQSGTLKDSKIKIEKKYSNGVYLLHLRTNKQAQVFKIILF